MLPINQGNRFNILINQRLNNIDANRTASNDINLFKKHRYSPSTFFNTFYHSVANTDKTTKLRITIFKEQ